MLKKCKWIFCVLLVFICITSLCLPFLLPKTKADDADMVIQQEIQAENTGASIADKSKKGGALYIEKGAVYNMKGGCITGMYNVYGGAVYVSDGATFNMEGGTINGCQAKYGGAIYVESGGEVNITNGIITGNFAENAPAIYVEDGGVVNIDAETSIEDNLYKFYLPISKGTVIVGSYARNFRMHYIDFGLYPQWYVGDEMNETLESWYQLAQPTKEASFIVRTRTWNLYTYTDGRAYVRGESTKSVGNEGESFNCYYLNGDEVRDTGEFAWFSLDTIRWIILNYDEYTSGSTENLEVMSYYALTGDIKFNADDNVEGCNLWVDSEIRSWLNENFYNSVFSAQEQAKILTTQVKNNVGGDYNSSSSNSLGVATEDKIYLLSNWDYIDKDGVFLGNAYKRLCSPTDFALSNNCYKNVDTGHTTALYKNGGTCNYWTRSAGQDNYLGSFVGYFSDLRVDAQTGASRWGIRPAMTIKI